MEVKALQDILIKILCSELNETELDSAVKDQLTPDVIAALYRFSKAHDLVHIVSSALGRCGLLGADEISAKYQKQELLAVYRCEQFRYELQQICTVFDKAGIPYIPLKGSVIRPYYPRESMRTSCDIDVLIREEDLERAIDILKADGYRCGEKNYHDVSLFSPANVHLELHFNILENIEGLDVILERVWEYASPDAGSRYSLNDDFFLFYMLAHMSYHFLHGGCGIRSLLDIWVIEHKMGIRCDRARALLEQAGIYKFSQEISRLADACFSGNARDAFSDELLLYIFYGGIYGNRENSIAINEAKTHLTAKYMTRRVFVPFRDLKIEYPVLKKAAVLYPFCWIHRSFKLGTRLAKRLLLRSKTKRTVSEEDMSEAVRLRKRLGL